MATRASGRTPRAMSDGRAVGPCVELRVAQRLVSKTHGSCFGCAFDLVLEQLVDAALGGNSRRVSLNSTATDRARGATAARSSARAARHRAPWRATGPASAGSSAGSSGVDKALAKTTSHRRRSSSSVTDHTDRSGPNLCCHRRETTAGPADRVHLRGVLHHEDHLVAPGVSPGAHGLRTSTTCSKGRSWWFALHVVRCTGPALAHAGVAETSMRRASV